MVARAQPDHAIGAHAIGATAEALDPIKAALVDPHALLTHALTEELSRTGVPTTAVWANSAEELIVELDRTEPQIVLLEVELPDPPGPPERLISAMRQTGARVVMLSSSYDHQALGRCLDAGAVGIVDKNRASFTELVAAIRTAAGNSETLDWHSRTLLAELRRSEAEEQKRRAPFALLTPREGEVLTLMCRGWGPTEIAQETFVSLATVRSHIRSILLKLGVHSQLAAAALAYHSGWYQA